MVWSGNLAYNQWWYLYKLGHSSPDEKEFECVSCKKATSFMFMGLAGVNLLVGIKKPGFIRWATVIGFTLCTLASGVCYKAAIDATDRNETKRLRILKREIDGASATKSEVKI